MTTCLVVVVLCLSPFALSADAHAGDGHSHAAAGHDSGPVPADHDHIDHGVVHCGTFGCTSSFAYSCQTACVARRDSVRFLQLTGDDPPLRSLYLESDPPVPRGGFSLA